MPATSGCCWPAAAASAASRSLRGYAHGAASSNWPSRTRRGCAGSGPPRCGFARRAARPGLGRKPVTMNGELSVLHVAQPTDGGVANYVIAACLDQARRGWDVAVACPDGGRLAAELANAGIPRVHWHAERSPGPGSLGEAGRLGSLIALRRPDLVHLHASKAGLA